MAVLRSTNIPPLSLFDSSLNARLRKWAIVFLTIGAVAGTIIVSAISVSRCSIPSCGTIAYTKQIDRFDLNGDGRFNIIDAAMVVRSFGSSLGDGKWNPSLDFNGDNKINEVDLSILARNYRRK